MFHASWGMHRRDLLILLGALAGLPAVARAAEETKKKSGGASYLPVTSLTATTLKGGGRRGVLSVDCGLDVPDGRLRSLAERSMPRLRAAYVQVVVTYAAGLPPGAPPNPDFIGLEMQRQTDLILGRPGARLLLGAVTTN